MKWRAILACLLWSSAFAGAKIGFQYADPIYLSGLRFTLAGILLVPVMIIKKVDLAGAMKHWPFMLLFAFVQTFLQYGFFFVGLSKVPGAISSIIIGASPLFVAVMAHITLKNDKITHRKIAALTLGLLGIVFISLAHGGISSGDSRFYLGVGLLLLSNVVGSYTNIMVVKRKDYNISPYVLTAFANFAGGIMLLIASFVVERPRIEVYPIEFYAALIWLAIIPAAAFSLWYGLLQRPGVKVSELNMWKFIIPVFGSLLSWILLPGEGPNIPTVAGIAIIVTALVMYQYKNGKVGK